MIGIDTNILVRHVTEDEPAQTERAARYLEANCSASNPGFVNRLVLCELVWVLERLYHYRREDIAGLIDALLTNRDLRLEDEHLVATAREMFVRVQIDFADALIAAVNLTKGCTATATFDRQAAVAPGFVAVP